MKKGLKLLVTLISAALILTACSGGGGSSDGSSTGSTSGDVSSLTVAEKISVVDAQLSDTAANVQPLRMGVFRVTAADLPANSDYNTDETFVYVEERSAGAFGIINEILCMIAQSGYDAMLNQGPYTALIDRNQCATERDDASSAGQEQSQNQSSGANMPDYEMWTVESTRPDNNSPQTVKVWVHDEGGEFDPPQIIFVRAIITESVSETNPYGIFTMNFIGYPLAQNGSVDTSNGPIFKGYLKSERDSSGKVLLKFANEGGMGNDIFIEKATLYKNPDGSGGAGSVYSSDTWGGQTHTESFDIAFDQNYFLRDNGVEQVCLDRQNFDESAWRYGLYDSVGNRVNRNSGFPIKVTVNSTDYHGWVGYWGIWMPEEIQQQLQSGDTVYKVDYGPNGPTETPYTLFIGGGRLIKHTRNVLSLDDIVNVPMEYWEWDHQAGTDSQYRVVWDGTDFMKVAILTDQQNWTWSDLNPAQPIDLASLNWPDLNFWSPALGGQVRIIFPADPNTTPHCTQDPTTMLFDCSTVINNADVIVYTEETVYPTDTVPSTLQCYEMCPDPSAMDTQDPYFPWSQTTAYDYTFDGTNYSLLYNNTAVETSNANQTYEWGIMSGPMINPADAGQLTCDWDANQICPWKAWDLPVFYTWETGPNEWNRFTGLQYSDGTFVTFDPPLQVKYVHTWPDNSTSTFFLEYGGFGELWGIPGKCVDMDNGQDAPCGPDTRWVPEFSIPDVDANGQLTTVSANVNGSNVTYFVKALEKEQRMMVATDPNACSGLAVSGYSLPDIADWEDPDIGSEPAVTDPPAVIGGEVQ